MDQQEIQDRLEHLREELEEEKAEWGVPGPQSRGYRLKIRIEELERVLDIPEKSIGYQCNHIDPILDGDKTLTIRWDFHKDISEGDSVRFVTPRGYIFATAEITGKKLISAQEFVEQNYDGHKEYDSVDQLLSEMEGYYHEEFRPQTKFDLLQFDADPYCSPKVGR